MPHIDITMIPGRDDTEKKELAVKIQRFVADELGIDKKFVSVSIEDIAKENWNEHIQNMCDKKMFLHPIKA